jgi:hypothetical protein
MRLAKIFLAFFIAYVSLWQGRDRRTFLLRKDLRKASGSLY